MRLAAELRPDPLGSLQRSRRPLSWILGIGAGKQGEREGGEEWKGSGERGEEERKGGEAKGKGRNRPR